MPAGAAAAPGAGVAGPATGEPVRVEVVRAESGHAATVYVTLPAGATLADALAAAAQARPDVAWTEGASGYAIWNRAVRPEQPLAEGDRVEVLRPVTADPKLARQRKVEAARRAAPKSKWLPDRRNPGARPSEG